MCCAAHSILFDRYTKCWLSFHGASSSTAFSEKSPNSVVHLGRVGLRHIARPFHFWRWTSTMWGAATLILHSPIVRRSQWKVDSCDVIVDDQAYSYSARSKGTWERMRDMHAPRYIGIMQSVFRHLLACRSCSASQLRLAVWQLEKVHLSDVINACLRKCRPSTLLSRR